MFCEKCGAKVSEHARFCPDCGAPVVHSQETVVVPKAASAAAGVDADKTVLATPDDAAETVLRRPKTQPVQTATNVMLGDNVETKLMDRNAETRRMYDAGRPGSDGQHFREDPTVFLSETDEPSTDAGLYTMPDETSSDIPVEQTASFATQTSQEPALNNPEEAGADASNKSTKRLAAGIIIGIVVVAAVVFGIFMLTVPKQQQKQPVQATSTAQPKDTVDDATARKLYSEWVGAKQLVRVPISVQEWQQGSTRPYVEVSGTVYATGQEFYTKIYGDADSISFQLEPGNYNFKATGLGFLADGRLYRGNEQAATVQVGRADSGYNKADEWIAKLKKGEKLPTTSVDVLGTLNYTVMASATAADVTAARAQAAAEGSLSGVALDRLVELANEQYGIAQPVTPQPDSGPSTATIDEWVKKATQFLTYYPANCVYSENRSADPQQLTVSAWAVECLKYLDPSCDLAQRMSKDPDAVAKELGFNDKLSVVKQGKMSASDDHGVSIAVDGLSTQQQWSSAESWQATYYVHFNDKMLIDRVSRVSSTALANKS